MTSLFEVDPGRTIFLLPYLTFGIIFVSYDSDVKCNLAIVADWLAGSFVSTLKKFRGEHCIYFWEKANCSDCPKIIDFIILAILRLSSSLWRKRATTAWLSTQSPRLKNTLDRLRTKNTISSNSAIAIRHPGMVSSERFSNLLKATIRRRMQGKKWRELNFYFVLWDGAKWDWSLRKWKVWNRKIITYLLTRQQRPDWIWLTCILLHSAILYFRKPSCFLHES